jgi:hypothetical protein
MKGKILVTLFALPFFSVGVWMLWSIGSSFYDAWQMRDWVQVEAQLISGGYATHDDTYEAYARYTYSFNGQTYTGHRVSIAGGADSVGDYQQDMGRRLVNAQARQQPIPVYVDPDNPSRAIIDRDIRWLLIGFKSIFLFVFGGVGLGLLILAWRAPKEKDKSLPQYADSPWLLNDDWQTPSIRSNSRGAMYFTWGFAAVWNLISAPTPFLAYREITESGNWLALIALLFPVVGIGLLVWAVRRTLEWRRFGAAPVTLDPFPGSIGGHVGGSIDLNMPFDANAKYQLTLTSIHSYMSGSGKNRSRNEKAKWQDRIVAHAEPGGKGTRLTFRFDVPEGQNESDAEQDDSYHLWRLSLTADLPGTDLNRDYEIPVYATAQRSRYLSNRIVEKARAEQSNIDAASVRDIVNLATGSTGKRMFFPIGRFFSSSIGGVIVGAIFAAAGWYLIVKEGHSVFGSVFGGLGALIAIGCFYMICNSLEIRQDGARIVTIRRLLGIPISHKTIHKGDIVELKKKSNFKTQSGGKHTIFYNIHAIDREGNKFVVGEGFKGESEANAAKDLIRREFGLRLGRESEEEPIANNLPRFNALANDG